MEIKVKIEDQEIRESLSALQNRMSDLSPVMKNIGEIVHASIRRNFEVGGRPKRREPSMRVKREGGQTLIRKGTAGGLLVCHLDVRGALSVNRQFLDNRRSVARPLILVPNAFIPFGHLAGPFKVDTATALK
ncbi:MAG: hypothetical protein QM278_12025 [Pseudomonadota bacterium]|nr:hypothetical protein [Pseudomonadota bacterium]